MATAVDDTGEGAEAFDDGTAEVDIGGDVVVLGAVGGGAGSVDAVDHAEVVFLGVNPVGGSEGAVALEGVCLCVVAEADVGVAHLCGGDTAGVGGVLGA